MKQRVYTAKGLLHSIVAEHGTCFVLINIDIQDSLDYLQKKQRKRRVRASHAILDYKC